MKKIESLAKEFIWGKFNSFDYGLIVGSFSYNGSSEDDIGMSKTTIEEFIDNNPVPIYLGEKYSDKLQIKITLIKNPHIFHDNLYFYEKDCRTILRTITGIKGYQWLKLTAQILNEDLWYRAKVANISYKRVGGYVVGIILNFECDSSFAWSKEYTVLINAIENQHFSIYNNTDDLNNYVYPLVSITSTSAGNVEIINLSDNNFTSKIENVKSNEKITIDSKHQIITSNKQHQLLLDDFNLGWIRLVPDKNEYVCNTNIQISMKFRVPRKVGIVCELDEYNSDRYYQVNKNIHTSHSNNDAHLPISLSDIDTLFKE